MPSRTKVLSSSMVTAALCAAAGVASHRLLAHSESIDLWHPATGLALAILVRGGLRFTWAVLAGVLLEVWLTHGVNSSSVALIVGGVAGPVCGAWLLRRQRSFNPRLVSLGDYLRLMAWGGVLGSLAAALSGSMVLLWTGAATISTAPTMAMRWGMGNLLGVALISPAVLVWWGVRHLRLTRLQVVESAFLAALTFMVGQMVFLDWFTHTQYWSPVGYWMFLFVAWTALRWERRGVALVLLMIAAQALTGIHLGIGFLAESIHNTHLLPFWRYMLALSFMGYALACYVTGRRREARALQAHAAALREHAMDKVQEGVTLGNAKGELVYVNEAFMHLTGYSREELLGHSCGKRLQGPDTNKVTAELLRASIKAGKPFRTELLNYRKDGTPFWNDLSITPIFDEHGLLIEYFGMQRDITVQKEAAAALQKSEEQLKLVLKGSNDGIWDWNLAADTLECSPRWYQILGYGEHERGANGTLWWDIIHPDDLPRIRHDVEHLLVSGQERYELEMRIRHKDGHYITALSRGYSQRDAQGKPVRLCGTLTDLTEKAAKEIRFRLANTVFQQSREGITMTDASGNIVMVNRAFTEITGYTEAEVLGKNPRFLASGRHNNEFYAAMWKGINTHGCWAGEIWDQRKDGTVFPAWMSITAMRDEQGTLTHYLNNFSDISDVQAAKDRIQWLSHFDALTGLPNRTLLQDRTEYSISMAQRAGETFSMMLVGIDHFHIINDTLGHTTSDALLVEVAKRLGACVREQDTIARLAGKELVLVLPGTEEDGAAHLATELLWKLAQPYELDGQEVSITVSIGIALYPSSASDFDALLKAAEIAMHRAQVNGLNSFQFYSEKMYQQVREHNHMLKALRTAVARDQLHLLYQPLVDLGTGQISGMEALLRWHHPELGNISPSRFIPLAEESGLIKDIGEWVLQRACHDIRTWLDKGIQVPHVAVNISPIQLQDDNLVAQVKRCLSEAQLAPELIYLEVTEGALMEDVNRSEAILNELKNLGVKLSLDDFGTGYSSLSYLKRFPFDKVKIDQSFVRDIGTSQTDVVLVKVIISMAHGLGLKVIAEGVETEAQCEIMRVHACDEIQGYLFSTPISAQAIEALFTEGRQLPAHLLRFRKRQRTLLLVDDEPNVLASLKRLFRRDGATIFTASSGAEGLEVLAKNKVDVIISDQRMPGMSGVEFLRAAKISHPDTIRIVLSGYTELQSVTDAINEGAIFRFLTKPWEDAQLREQILKAFEFKELQEENQQLDIKIRTTNQELVTVNRQLGEVLQKTRTQIERDETSLAVVREALQYMPVPVIGIDDEGLMAFVNTAAESLFAHQGSLLGVELAHALPAIDAVITNTEEGASGEVLMDRTRYCVKWNAMGGHSRSRGKIVTVTKTGSVA